jgi:hypothetical protein
MQKVPSICCKKSRRRPEASSRAPTRPRFFLPLRHIRADSICVKKKYKAKVSPKPQNRPTSNHDIPRALPTAPSATRPITVRKGHAHCQGQRRASRTCSSMGGGVSGACLSRHHRHPSIAAHATMTGPFGRPIAAAAPAGAATSTCSARTSISRRFMKLISISFLQMYGGQTC